MLPIQPGRKMFRIVFDRDDVNGVRLMRMNIYGETEIRWQVATHLVPVLPSIIAPHHVPMFLHKNRIRF